MEKRELDFITIDGKYYGGDQNWHTRKMMKMGGCSAVTACEVCMFLAKERPALRDLYPYDPRDVTKDDFLKFFESMFHYIYPGMGGLTSLDKFSAMLRRYIDTTGVRVEVGQMAGNEPYAAAEHFVKNAIDSGLPIMYLMLKHRDEAFSDYEWHWFTITGYEEKGEGLFVTFATWGDKHSFLLEKAWNTGKAWRGGMVIVKEPEGE